MENHQVIAQGIDKCYSSSDIKELVELGLIGLSDEEIVKLLNDVKSELINKYEYSESNWRISEVQNIIFCHTDILIGTGATIHYWSDSSACTVIGFKKLKKGRVVTVQIDKAIMKDSFKPEIIAGGFVGHCVNNHEQEYDYEKDTEGRVFTFSLRKNGKWVLMGSEAKSGTRLSIGFRRKFHDYNF